jgi:putative endonuclease
MKTEHDYWVYILTNWKKTVLYVGITDNLSRRLVEHYNNRGRQESFAGKYYCYNLVYYEWHQYVNNALTREKEIKKLLREKKIAIIEESNPEWKFFNAFICGEWPPRDTKSEE